MIALVDERRAELGRLCRRYGVRRLELFGSAVTGVFLDATSDLDFIADFADRSPGYADRYLDFAEALEALFGRKVDLLTEESIRNRYFRREVDATRQTVYEAHDPHAVA